MMHVEAIDVQVRCHSCSRVFEALAGSVKAECPDCGAQIDITSMETRASPAGGAGSPAAHADRMIGMTLGGYRLASLIGSGGMGVVFSADRTEDASIEGPAQAAIKVLSPSISEQHEFVARFQREAQALTRLQHPNLIEVFGHGSEDLLLEGQVRRFHFFVMELFEGEDLRALIKKGSLSPSAMAAVIQGAAAGLAAAHTAGVVHRDVKPANILVRGDPREGGVVKVVDFGVAHIALGEYTVTDLTSSELLLGTVNYMAPEQRIDAQKIDARADVYALGVVAYELLTGQLPIGAFETPSALVPELPRSIDEPILWALQRSPDRRCPDVSTLALRLDRAIAPRGASRPILLAAAGAMLVALAGSAYLSLDSGGELPKPSAQGAAETAPPQVETKQAIEEPLRPLAETIVEAVGQAEQIQAAPPEPEPEPVLEQKSDARPSAKKRNVVAKPKRSKPVPQRAANNDQALPVKTRASKKGQIKKDVTLTPLAK